MKKVLIVVFALLLALPAVSFAGSATSRWDLTIGGFVKADLQYMNYDSTGSNTDTWVAPRDTMLGRANVAKENGSLGMASGSTALNFLIKGPDAWGAKTSAFISGNFQGQSTNGGVSGTRYGTFTMGLAYVDFTWATTKMTIGTNWQVWGFLPSYNLLGAWDLSDGFSKGNFMPQIAVTQNLTKNFYGTVAIQYPYNQKDNLGFSNDTGSAYGPFPSATQATASYATPAPGAANLSNGARVSTVLPDFAGEIGFKSDACGVIGPQMLQFGVGGIWGQDNITYLDPANNVGYKTQHLDRWATSFKWYVPIIPEKNLNKTGALSFSGSVMAGQNQSSLGGPRGIIMPLPFDADPSVAGVRYTTPTTMGGWGQVSYYFTDKVYFNGLMMHFQNSGSQFYRNRYPNFMRAATTYIGNILYDVNPAVRVGIQGEYGVDTYNNFGTSSALTDAGQLAGFGGAAAPILDSKGSYWQGRVALWYFF